MSFVVAIIQARMGSTRLPGKVLADLGELPLLAHVISRAQRISGIDRVIVATTTDNNQPIVDVASKCGASTFTGNEDDVLDRYYRAALHYDASVVMRITADCPFLDPEISRRVLARFHEGGVDYAANNHPPTYPNGLDTEVFSLAALEQAWREADLLSEREHVTPYIWKNPALFRLANVGHDIDLSDKRWTVDDPKDLDFARAVLGHLSKDEQWPDLGAILEALSRHPELENINAGTVRNEGYAKSLEMDRRVSQRRILEDSGQNVL